MTKLFDDLEKRVRNLTPEEKAALVRILIEDLDSSVVAHADQPWIDEAQRLYDEYVQELEGGVGEDAMVGSRRALE
jgi:hypothetical protein